MSSTSQTSNQATASMSGTNKNYESSPEAAYRLESPTSATKHTGNQDSGFYEDDSISYEYRGKNDFILYDDPVNREEEDTFDLEEPVDIASTKADHGSLFNKTGNSSSQSYPQYQTSSSSQYRYQYEHGVEEVENVGEEEEEEEEEDRPRHRFSTPIDNITEKGFSTLDEWTMTYHRHESIAYRLEQPPNPTYIFRDLQQSWGYDFDIELS